MEQHVEFVKNVARTRFAAEAELEPMALIFAETESAEPAIMLVPPPVSNGGLDQVTKDRWYEGIRRIIARLVAQGANDRHMMVVIATEAWMVRVHADDVAAADGLPRPSECEGRKEIVMLSVETKSRRKMYMADIRRGDDGAALGPFVDLGGDDDGERAITGAATGFFA